jgi:predicted nuclease of predicted toxin-antitoxin system
MLRFLIDTQLPPKLAEILNQRGCEAVHTTVYAEGPLMKDRSLIEIAVEEHRIIITKDSDFLDHFLLKGAPPKVLLLGIGNAKNRRLFDAFRANFTQIQHLFDEGANLVLFEETRLIGY